MRLQKPKSNPFGQAKPNYEKKAQQEQTKFNQERPKQQEVPEQKEYNQQRQKLNPFGQAKPREENLKKKFTEQKIFVVKNQQQQEKEQPQQRQQPVEEQKVQEKQVQSTQEVQQENKKIEMPTNDSNFKNKKKYGLQQEKKTTIIKFVPKTNQDENQVQEIPKVNKNEEAQQEEENKQIFQNKKQQPQQEKQVKYYSQSWNKKKQGEPGYIISYQQKQQLETQASKDKDQKLKNIYECLDDNEDLKN